MRWFVARALVAVFGVLPAAAHAQAGAPVHIGVLAFMGEAVAAQEWLPLAAYLEQALPAHRFELEYGSLEELADAVAQGRIDFILTNPGHYVELEIHHGVSRIATLAHGRDATSNLAVAAAVIARRDRADLQALGDLRGRVLAATSADGFGGYQIVWRELLDVPLDPERDLAARRFVGFPMQRVLQAIDAGEADAGIVRACLLETLSDWPQRYRVLSGRIAPELGCMVSSRLYPNWALASLRHTSPELARALAIALLQMDAQRDGMAWNVPADYQAIHDVFRELRIGPYAYLRVTTLRGFIQNYWPYGVLLLGLLLGWLAYTLRVESLVRSRTAALQRALDERQAFEQRMRANQEQAEHLSRLSVLGELSSTLAHELSQPLAGVSNYAQSLLRRLGNGRLTDAAVREASENIVTQAHTAAGILKRIKGFVRKRASVRERHALPSVVAEAVALFEGMQLHAPTIQIDNRLPEALRVRIDPLQIQQILLNFFKNAQDAMQALPAGEPRIDICMDAGDGWASIHVRDYGIGMRDAQMQRLFEPFYTSKDDGLGLGLSICKSMAEAHGGQLQGRRPDDGPGMVFSLSLPIDEHTPQPLDLPR